MGGDVVDFVDDKYLLLRTKEMRVSFTELHWAHNLLRCRNRLDINQQSKAFYPTQYYSKLMTIQEALSLQGTMRLTCFKLFIVP